MDINASAMMYRYKMKDPGSEWSKQTVNLLVYYKNYDY